MNVLAIFESPQMNRLFSFLCIVLALSFTAPVMAAEPLSAAQVQQKREAFAHGFAQTVLAILQDTKKNYSDRKDVVRQAFAKSVDIDWIAKFVLGSQWRTATDEQKARYTMLYKKYLTETYVSNFADNPDKRIRDIKIFGVSDSTDSDFNVRTEMQLADSENMKVNYLVRETNGKYKILDIAIENVSLITTHRGEFSKLAAKSGVDGVIATLEKLASKPAEMKMSMN